MDNVLWVIDNIGRIGGVIAVLGFFYAVYLWWRGIWPVLIRLGHGFAKRKVTILADHETSLVLKSMLIDSGLFQKGNIGEISIKDCKTLQSRSLILAQWSYIADNINELIEVKDSSTALIVYAPPSEGDVDVLSKGLICNERNSILVNSKGRLMNDLVSSLITTDEKKRV